MAEFIRVPTEIVRGDCVAVNDLTPEQAVFIEPLACCAKAMRRINRIVQLAGSSGAIIGCGIMGMLNLLAARAFRAADVIAVELESSRRAAALRHGFTSALAPEEADRSLLGTADFVVIGPGHPDVIQQGLKYVRPGGAVCLFTP
ncbi:MAG: zinc-binding dehydrogenase, partial [Candidatus Acidiferrum sp.]